MCPSSFDIWLRNLASHKGTRKETKKCTKRNGEKMIGITFRDRKRATWIREQTRVENVLSTIKMKKGSWALHIMRRTDKRWTKIATGWEPRNCNKSQGKQRVRWRDEITAVAGAGWSTLTSDGERLKRLGKAFVPQFTING